ncbi:MAG: FAD-dependent oxidoreductase [Anaerolineales bacterium]
MTDLIVIGGGLAGSEAAWQAAQRGLNVRLYEMRPVQQTGAHQSQDLAELVCSNSLGSNLPDRASGVLKNEMRTLGSMLLECAEKASLPAGGALAVDRELFARFVTERIESHPKIEIVREEVREIPASPTIIASGPLTSPALSQDIAKLSGEEHLFFFDAIAPVIHAEIDQHGGGVSGIEVWGKQEPFDYRRSKHRSVFRFPFEDFAGRR